MQGGLENGLSQSEQVRGLFLTAVKAVWETQHLTKQKNNFFKKWLNIGLSQSEQVEGLFSRAQKWVSISIPFVQMSERTF